MKYEKEAVDVSKRFPFYCEQTVKRKLLYDFGGRMWKELSLEERDSFGKKRADSHNYLETHTESYVENLALMKDIVAYLAEWGIKMHVVVTPYSQEYLAYVSGTMKEAFFRMMEEAGVPSVIDFNDPGYSKNFEADDFQDTDHLNEHGAEKLSKIIAERLIT